MMKAFERADVIREIPVAWGSGLTPAVAGRYGFTVIMGKLRWHFMSGAHSGKRPCGRWLWTIEKSEFLSPYHRLVVNTVFSFFISLNNYIKSYAINYILTAGRDTLFTIPDGDEGAIGI